MEPFVLAHRDGSPTTLCQLSLSIFSRLHAVMPAVTTLHLLFLFFPLPSPSDGPFQVFVDRLDAWGSRHQTHALSIRAVLVPCQGALG